MSEIRAANLAAGGKFFKRDTLRFFGETMRNYSAGKVLPDGRQVFARRGGKAGSKLFVFDPKDGSCRSFAWPE